MFSNSDKKFDKLVQKHGNAPNQKSSFYNLMKQKTKRGEKPVENKQNEDKRQMLQQSLQKYVKEYKRNKPHQKDFFSIIPLTNIEISNQKQALDKNEIQNELTTQSYQEIAIKEQNTTAQLQKTEVYCPIIKQTAQVACMTEEFYQEKQLAIKIKILKKERDQLWESITEILKQNEDLKYLLSQHQRKKNQVVSAITQTDLKNFSICEIQTDINYHQLDKIYQYTSKNNQEKQQLFTFFSQLPIQNLNLTKESLSSLNLTGVFIQALNSQLTYHTKEWQGQKASMNSYFEQQMNYFKIIEQKYAQSNEQLSSEASQLREIKRQLEEQLQISFRKVNFHEQTTNGLTIKLAEQALQIKDLNINIEKLNNFMEQQKRIWDEKNNKYSRLLGQSHKTIQNLINQMRDFQQLACETYGKYLHSNRINHLNL